MNEMNQTMEMNAEQTSAATPSPTSALAITRQRIYCLKVIQRSILQMWSCSLACKAVGVLWGVLAIFSPWFALPIAACWILDAQYSRRERMFRAMETDAKFSDEPRLNEFCFDPDEYTDCVQKYTSVLLSPMMSSYYLAIGLTAWMVGS